LIVDVSEEPAASIFRIGNMDYHRTHPLKRLLTIYQTTHGDKSKKTAALIFTAVRISNLIDRDPESTSK
jgi:hypothetical protein